MNKVFFSFTKGQLDIFCLFRIMLFVKGVVLYDKISMTLDYPSAKYLIFSVPASVTYLQCPELF